MSVLQGVGGWVIVDGKSYAIASWNIRPVARRDAAGKPVRRPSPLVPPELLAAVALTKRTEKR